MLVREPTDSLKLFNEIIFNEKDCSEYWNREKRLSKTFILF